MGLGAFALFLVPILAIQYRLYGGFTPLRLLGAAAMAIYGAALFAYTLLPLPNPATLQCAPGSTGLAGMWDGVQKVPFASLGDIARETAGMSLIQAAKSFVVLQVVFNVVLFIPWGLIARRFLGWGVLASTLSGFLGSLLIETTQLTGVFGFYACAYRLGDVDDLITNTSGALLGALLAPVVLWFFPQRRAFQAGRRTPRPVTAPRRWLGMLIDYVAYSALGFVLSLVYTVGANVLDIPVSPWVVAVVGMVLPGLAVFILPALAPTGASLGQRAVWLAVSSTPPSSSGVQDGADGGAAARTPRPFVDAPLGRRLVRASALGGVFVLADVVSELSPDTGWGVVAGFIYGFLPAVAVISVLSTPSRRGLSGKLAGTYIVDARS